jgi:hypothetical protein
MVGQQEAPAWSPCLHLFLHRSWSHRTRSASVASDKSDEEDCLSWVSPSMRKVAFQDQLIHIYIVCDHIEFQRLYENSNFGIHSYMYIYSVCIWSYWVWPSMRQFACRQPDALNTASSRAPDHLEVLLLDVAHTCWKKPMRVPSGLYLGCKVSQSTMSPLFGSCKGCRIQLITVLH